MLCKLGIHKWVSMRTLRSHDYCAWGYSCVKGGACNSQVVEQECKRCGKIREHYMVCP